MSGQASRFLDGLRRPEYTGENRCVPCTVLNVAIALAASAIVATFAVEVAALVLVLSLLAIYLRGYLVPGTPALTKRYLPTRVLALFEEHPLEAMRDEPVEGEDDEEQTFETLEKLENERKHSVDPEQFLVEEGVVGPCEDGTDICFTEEFGAAVERRLADGDLADPEKLAEMFDSDPDDVSFLDREYPAIKIGHRIRKWPSEGALVADVAEHDALVDRTERWADVPIEQRRRILESLRGFHERCPICGGAIRYSDEVVESCCGQFGVTRIACVECDERLLEFDPSKVGAEEVVKGFTP